MTELEIYERMDAERTARGLSATDYSRKTYHSPFYWKNLGQRLKRGEGCTLKTLCDFLEPLDMEIIVRKITKHRKD